MTSNEYSATSRLHGIEKSRKVRAATSAQISTVRPHKLAPEITASASISLSNQVRWLARLTSAIVGPCRGWPPPGARRPRTRRSAELVGQQRPDLVDEAWVGSPKIGPVELDRLVGECLAHIDVFNSALFLLIGLYRDLGLAPGRPHFLEPQGPFCQTGRVDRRSSFSICRDWSGCCYRH